MASRSIYDPMAALAVAPLISSSCTLWFAWDQTLFLRIFNHDENRSKSNEILSGYWKAFLPASLPRVVGLLGLTFWGVVGNYYWRHDSLVSNQSLKWYIGGAALSASHLLFTPLVVPRIQTLIDDDRSKMQPSKVLDEWLSIHALRTWTVDVAAWACIAVAVMRNITV
ncbi:putative integral membrane protein [Talaromyces proteolyticus]|uniref:Integral membrane protein n=1 Tax=Talaromyces proteolyticus TaxID=1131652 RepID=A0AAD4Q172_9EURO|nr:putative integral membrane protein [Talaromyces proteolyticus]KAH8697953.1 putative integral membrane protein [Talaromyces proteolyticus]